MKLLIIIILTVFYIIAVLIAYQKAKHWLIEHEFGVPWTIGDMIACYIWCSMFWQAVLVYYLFHTFLRGKFFNKHTKF